MATTWKTIAVRIERPSEVSPAEFSADIQAWLDHHCIMLAAFSCKGDVFDALFDNPRDARLFERRFATQPTSSIPARITPRRSVGATASSTAAPSLGGLVPVGTAV
jgi:hypothetical protein